ncbi:uncharacterized protein N7477_003839 [Penicillium maclennaniae]|uniref:uncharacterized protein n=1 Tax=Penicillium maclennaniae TaxID=1343394 RepID=UPI00253F7FF7|nr:uncharacterized protein N7477_003839 [Penicillium maclennaniae]KAJ5678206.1 hypothetical protein N7477_003839 [Penicillium maclennaniae]
MPPPNSASHGTPALSPASDQSRSFASGSAEIDNAHDENVNFLRSRSLLYNPLLPSLSRHRRRRYQSHQPMEDEDPWDRMDLDDPDLRLSVEINRRIPIAAERIPGPCMAGPPGSDDEDEDTRRPEESEDDQLQLQPFPHGYSSHNVSSTRARESLPTGRTPPIINGDEPMEGSTRSRNSPIPTMEALLQSMRPQPRLPRNRTLESYLLDRYTRSSDNAEESERTSGSSSSRAYRYRPSSRGDSQRVLTHSDLRARAAAHRQLHSAGSVDSMLKNTINYLDRLRYSNSFEESISSAAATGFISLDNFSWKDTSHRQRAAPGSDLEQFFLVVNGQRMPLARYSPSGFQVPHGPSEPVIVNSSDSSARISVHTSSRRRYLASTRDENWPVKVTIHNINYDDMTLSGTMEAYNIPDKTSPTHDAHIVTFLEGEIIDFNKHTLETKNFKADADIDSTYWRELQPFKDLTDTEISKNLVSRKWITEKLAKGWILMRWKERCFITPTDSRQGLTISGFYYISLRRDDGQVEGLYYDPGSSPYQQLSLKPETVKMVRPSYTFR